MGLAQRKFKRYRRKKYPRRYVVDINTTGIEYLKQFCKPGAIIEWKDFI